MMDELITVLATGNKAQIDVAKTVLDSAGIKYIIKGENSQDLFAAGRFGAGFNPLIGPVLIQVQSKDYADAKQLLSG